MERKVLDLLLLQVFGVERFQRHAVIAHALFPMPTHLNISLSWNLAVQLIQSVIQRRLFDHFPRVLDLL